MSLKELEISRKKTLTTSGVLYFLAGVLLLVGGYLIGAILVLYTRFLIRNFQADVKEALVAPLAEALGFRYSPGRGFSQEEALASGLFPPPDLYDSEDLVEGEVNGIPFASSDIVLYRKASVNNNGKRTEQYQKFFQGTLYRFHLPFSVEGEVRFGPRGMGMGMVDRQLLFMGVIFLVGGFLVATLKGLSEGLTAQELFPYYVFLAMPIFLFFVFKLAPRKESKELQRVLMESPEFERLYDVYGEDQIEARKLLTPRVQEALVRLRKYLRKPVWGAVRGSDLWLLVGGKDRFPVPILRPVSDIFETQKARYQEELSEVARVVEVLKLEEEAKRRGAWRRKIFLGLD